VDTGSREENAPNQESGASVLFDQSRSSSAARKLRRAASPSTHWKGTDMGGILWIIVVGFVAGIIARVLSPGQNNPSGFILTTVLGIAGAFLATWIGQAIGHYSPDQGAGFITATIGALVVLFIWNRLVARGMISDPGNR
jgi:uncharacterized membrane protein YeaQ/YmgE (transglycosylase-associated protein family)